MKKNILLLIFGITLFNSCEDTEKLNQATVYYNGDIITMVGDSPNYVEAIIEKEGKIIFTGSSNEAMKIAGKGHNMIDLEGKTLVPVFIYCNFNFANF
jgi:imidazolonepropionase-like amidohydrolase